MLLFFQSVDTSIWLGTKYSHKGWICVVVSEDPMIKTVTYKYPENELNEIENTWFKRETGIQNYQQVKYDPYIIERHEESFSDFQSDDEEQYEEEE